MKVKKKINSKVSLITYLLANEISIPHYCSHNNLSITENFRVCLVELKNSMKPVYYVLQILKHIIKSKNV